MDNSQAKDEVQKWLSDMVMWFDWVGTRERLDEAIKDFEAEKEFEKTRQKVIRSFARG